MKLFLKYIPVAFVLLVVASCKKDKTFPVAPEITFKEFQRFQSTAGIDDTVKLVISFTDGDGDVGYTQGDTLPPFDTSSIYYYNFYVKSFKKQNGVFVALPSLVPGARIPYINNSDKNKSLSGDIIDKLDLFGFGFNHDTLRFECYIYDRALHQSNVITTPEIIVTQ